jgi:hypothetical protein
MNQTDELIVIGHDRHADEALKRIYHENKSRILVCSSSKVEAVEE